MLSGKAPLDSTGKPFELHHIGQKNNGSLAILTSTEHDAVSLHGYAPREIREWFTAGQPIKRDTAFLICFAFSLDGNETDEFFRRYYARERSFNCHQVQEAIYYFCLNNGLSYAEALDIQTHVPLTGESRKSGDVVYTGSIIAELNDLETKEELIAYLTENISGSTFTVNQDAPSDLSR